MDIAMELLTHAEACQYLRVCARTLNRMVARGEISKIRLSWSMMFAKTQIGAA
jgi:excisionase family DNA binding protein